MVNQPHEPHNAAVPTIVMTGGTSGLGRIALDRFVERGARVLLATRGTRVEGAVGIDVDLAEVDGARAFADAVVRRLNGTEIDALVLNAGGFAARREGPGYDPVFVLNYLSHYLLVEELWPHLAPRSTIVLTTSGTHDPANGSGTPPPLHADAKLLVDPESDPRLDASEATATQRAYAASKLCVVLYARALARRAEETGSDVTVFAYDPGPTPGTGLARTMAPAFRILWERFPGLVRWRLKGKANTIENAGLTLADLATGAVPTTAGAVYAALRSGTVTWPAFSDLAGDDALVDALVRDSADLVSDARRRAGHE